MLRLMPVLLSLLMVSSVIAEDAIVAVELSGVIVEGGASAPAKAQAITVDLDGVPTPAVKLTVQHREKAYHAVRFPVAVDARTYNTLSFKVRFSGEADTLRKFGVWFADSSGNWCATHFSKHAGQSDAEGWYTFTWDVVNQPDIVRGADISAISRVIIKFPFSLIAEGKTVDVTIADMNFIAGRRADAGDPELFTQWQAHLDGYEADLSDSRWMLQPPQTGRIATPLPLVRGGTPRAAIVTPAKVTPVAALAGRELQYWVMQITGAVLPKVNAADAPSDLSRIFLGAEQAHALFTDDLNFLQGSDGYAVRMRGDDIYIFGSTGKGALNGVFAFLENNTDLIWPRPQPELSAVYSKTPDLDVVWADHRDKPATQLRGWATNLGLRPEHEIWSTRNRLNYPTGGGTVKIDTDRRRAQGNYIEFGGGHNLHAFVPKDRVAFYPTIDGEKPEKLNIWKHQLCFTHPDLVGEYTQGLLAYLHDKAPAGIDCMNVKIEDNKGVCTCDRCLTSIRLPDGSTLKSSDPAFRSTQFFMFLNAITRNVNAVYPELNIGTYAYFFTSTPPKIAIDPHIRIYFCPYIRKDQRTPLSAPINDHWWRQLTTWAEATDNVVIREYYGIMGAFRPLAETVAFDVRSYLQRGVKQYTAELNPDELVLHHGVMRGGRTEWDLRAIDFWVISRLYWNPDQDVEQLRKYYLRRTFRDAAPHMEAVYARIREKWFDARVPSDWEEPIKMAQWLIVRGGIEQELREHLRAAAAAAKHPVSRMMVDQVQMRLDQWVRWAKDRDAQKRETELDAERALLLGWSSNNDWGTNPAWASRTVIWRGGQTTPAVRVTIEPGRIKQKNAFIINRVVRADSAPSVLAFVIQSADDTPPFSPEQLQLFAEDESGARLTTPAGAVEARADGSTVVHWPLSSPDEAAKPFDATKIKFIRLTFDVDTKSDATLTYYMTDLVITVDSAGSR